MATADERALHLDAVTDRLERHGIDAVHLLVVNVVLFGLAARLYALGARTAHWDEGRVAYWIVDYMQTGNFEYRPIIHGPFYHHVNSVVFDVLGPSDFSMRLVVAVLTGLFPLVALLLRTRLRDVEVVALAAFLAVNPIVLYYSRFMRGDPLVAAFMVTAFACFVRAIDTSRVGYVHAGVVFTALGFTVKENALLYLVTWAGATVLVLDHRVMRADATGTAPRDRLHAYYRRARRSLWRYRRTAVLAVVEFVAIIVYFYAPRAQSESGPGLRKAISNLDVGMLWSVFWAGSVGAWQDMWGLWVSGGHQEHPYPSFFVDFVETLGHGAFALCLLTVVGFVADRYAAGGPRAIVTFTFAWGFASVLGYPLVTDIQAPWATIHAVIPLAVPAAVALGIVLRAVWRGRRDGEYLTAASGLFALLLIGASIATAGVGAVYDDPQSNDNPLVQYAQPADDIEPALEALSVAEANGERPDVILHSDYFVDDPQGGGVRQPGCSKWFNTLPLPWYFTATDADAVCTDETDQIGAYVEEYRPPVVIARSDDERDVAEVLDDYESRTYRLRVYGSETVVFVHEDYADRLPEPEDG